MAVDYFAFQANPDYYRIEEAVINLDVDTWDVHHSDLKPGDKAIIWKSYGRNQMPRRRGIVGFAEILSTPSRRASDNGYWIDSGGTQLRRRVDVKYVRPPNLPLWVLPTVQRIWIFLIIRTIKELFRSLLKL